MLAELGWVAAGLLAGTVSGLTPGLHINSIALLALQLPIEHGTGLMLFIVSMSIAHSFVDFIPSIYLGAPDSENYLSVLPGHRLLLKGKGIEAVQATVFGGQIGLVASLLLLPVFVLFVVRFNELLVRIMPFLLGFVLVLMVLGEEKAHGKTFSLLVIGLSGALGVLTLNVLQAKEGLFAAVSGLFGASTLLYSLGKEGAAPRQEAAQPIEKAGGLVGASLVGAIAAALASMVPGVGPSQAAYLSSKLSGKKGHKKFLALLGSINTCNFVFGFVVLWLLGKTRNGSAHAVSQFMEIGFHEVLGVAAVALLAGGVASVVTLALSKEISLRLGEISYSKMSLAVLAFLTALVAYFAGPLGLLVYGAGTAIGLFAVTAFVKRGHCMAFLVVPTLLYYLANGNYF